MGLTIGRTAKAAGVGVETIRFYERRGLIQQPHKPLHSGFRIYSAEGGPAHPLHTTGPAEGILAARDRGAAVAQSQSACRLHPGSRARRGEACRGRSQAPRAQAHAYRAAGNHRRLSGSRRNCSILEALQPSAEKGPVQKMPPQGEHRRGRP
jgi:MerR family mercuric resistance operon transcriptional regulator